MKKQNKKRSRSSFYFCFWAILSVMVQMLSASCVHENPGSTLIGATFLLVGQALYPTMEKYYEGLGTGTCFYIATGIRWFDGIFGVGLFISAALQIMLR